MFCNANPQFQADQWSFPFIRDRKTRASVFTIVTVEDYVSMKVGNWCCWLLLQQMKGLQFCTLPRLVSLSAHSNIELRYNEKIRSIQNKNDLAKSESCPK